MTSSLKRTFSGLVRTSCLTSLRQPSTAGRIHQRTASIIKISPTTIRQFSSTTTPQKEDYRKAYRDAKQQVNAKSQTKSAPPPPTLPTATATRTSSPASTIPRQIRMNDQPYKLNVNWSLFQKNPMMTPRKHSMASFWTIAALLIGIVGHAGFWEYAKYKQSQGDPSFYKWMTEHFSVNAEDITKGNYYKFFTSCFAHTSWISLIFTSLTLMWGTTGVMAIAGPVGFVTVYFAGGIMDVITSLTIHQYFENVEAKSEPSRGAQGSSNAILSYFAFFFPHAKIRLEGIIPVKAWMFVVGVLGLDLWLLPRIPDEAGGHAAGLLTGLAFAATKFYIR